LGEENKSYFKSTILKKNCGTRPLKKIQYVKTLTEKLARIIKNEEHPKTCKRNLLENSW